MRSLRPFLLAAFLLVAGLLVGCKQQPTGMNHQPQKLGPGTGGTTTGSGKFNPGGR